MNAKRRSEIIKQIKELDSTIRHCMIEKAKLREELATLPAKQKQATRNKQTRVLDLADHLATTHGSFKITELMERCILAGIEFPGNSLYQMRISQILTLSKKFRHDKPTQRWFSWVEPSFHLGDLIPKEGVQSTAEGNDTLTNS